MMWTPKMTAMELKTQADTLCTALAKGDWAATKTSASVATLLQKATARVGSRKQDATQGTAGKKGSSDSSGAAEAEATEAMSLKDVAQAMSLKEQRAFAHALFGVALGSGAVATSGRVFPVTNATRFVAGDFKLAEVTEWKDRSEHVSKALESAELPLLPADDITPGYLSGVALVAAAVISGERHLGIVRRDQEANRQWQSKVSGFHLGPKVKKALLHTVAFIDPLCSDAQRMAPMLMALSEVFNSHLHVILNPVAEMGSLPIKGYYRFVMKPAIDFNADGSVSSNLRATFTNLPVSKLLSMNLHPPNAWFVSAAHCVHDMDNVLLEKLASHETALTATYRLDHILVTGHCIDDSRQPPAGLQLELKAAQAAGKVPELVGDTLVMSNLGYFQLKARPGIFNLSIAEGRSREIYHLSSPLAPPPAGSVAVAVGNEGAAGRDWQTVSVFSWEPEVMSLSVTRRPAMLHARLLDSGDQADGGGGGGGMEEESLWSAMGSMFGAASPEKKKKTVTLALSELPVGKDHDTIHVFSLASGHLYERFLKIMMLSVITNTKAPGTTYPFHHPSLPSFLPSIIPPFHHPSACFYLRLRVGVRASICACVHVCVRA